MNKRPNNQHRDRTERTEATKSPKVFAVCPTNPDHPQASVYKTDGRTRYCKCDDCGAMWKQIGPLAGAKEVVT
jgi:formate dehydrogenase maturation protein FdhE